MNQELGTTGTGGARRRPLLALPNTGYKVLLAAAAALFAALVLWFLVAMVSKSRPAFSSLGVSFVWGRTWDPNTNCSASRASAFWRSRWSSCCWPCPSVSGARCHWATWSTAG